MDRWINGSMDQCTVRCMLKKMRAVLAVVGITTWLLVEQKWPKHEGYCIVIIDSIDSI